MRQINLLYLMLFCFPVVYTVALWHAGHPVMALAMPGLLLLSEIAGYLRYHDKSHELRKLLLWAGALNFVLFASVLFRAL